MKKIIALYLFAIGCQAQSVLLPADEFEQKMKQSSNYIILDVRTAGEYNNGHLDGATNLDVRNENFAQNIKVINKKKPIFLHCLSGGRSATAAKILVQEGFTEIYELQGGMAKWLAANKPTVKSESLSKDLSKVFTKEDFDKLVASEQPVLLDFFAPWCGPCQKMLPTILKLEQDYLNKAVIKTVDYDTNKELALSLGVDEIPMLLLYKKGKLVWRGIGATPENTLKTELDKSLK